MSAHMPGCSMKERPILFNAAMVRAVLAGTKTQTRRVVKPVGAHHLFQFRGTTAAAGADEPTGEWGWCGSPGSVTRHIHCPYGKPGDRLWVRETWQYAGFTEDGYPFVRYQADGARRLHDRSPSDEWSERWSDIWAGLSDQSNYDIDGTASDRRWRPSIHMPRWASRITLEVTGVRVERLQDISEADALAEGVDSLPLDTRLATPRLDFSALWESINGSGSWDANPWVWVVEFRRITP